MKNVNFLHPELLITLLAGLVLLMAGCGGGSGGSGGSTATPDTTAPTTTVAPAASGTTYNSTTFSATIVENGTGYYLVRSATDPAPTVSAVLAGTQFAMTANVAATRAISGLISNTAYTIYFVAKDTANNVQSAVQSVRVTTGYLVQGGLTWMPITFDDYFDYASYKCSSNTINGLNGWRLPTLQELYDLYISGLMNGQGWLLGSTWSSTPSSSTPGEHWSLVITTGDFYSGAFREYGAAYRLYVTCVR